MADRKTTSVDELYASRHRPYGQNRDTGSQRASSSSLIDLAEDI